MRPRLLFDLPLLKIRRFSINMTQKLLQILVENPIPFLKIPSSKQSLIADWIVQVLDLYNRRFSKTEFDLLGPALAFVSDEIFMAISRAAMKTNLLKIKDYCFDSQKKFLLGNMLTKDTMFGVTTNWTSLILDKIDRLVFFLSVDDIQKLPKIYRPVSAMPPKVIEQLGRIATQFTEKDLTRLDLSDLGTVAALGKIAEWNSRKLTVLFTSFLRVNRWRIDELDSVSLLALGHLICGIKQADMSAIDQMQFSMAVLWIGRLTLSCEEQQLAALAKLVTHSQTFGEVSQWRSEEFTEIGCIAAGLPDMVLSALVKEQIEGLTTVAVATIPPKKFSVVFSPTQIGMFNYQQAVAVTPAQLKELGDIQKKALDMVLTSWHKTAIDIRGRSSGGVISGSFIGVLLCAVCDLLHSRACL
ncbi:stereocilin [Carcharodon carcharias]|uniref:stereocilin n=1 Tax=Carcharodon carcharias TaxID=13397 RepID=UPI001B7E7EBD|nr:stereocilin [Carcharodon carcharias]